MRTRPRTETWSVLGAYWPASNPLTRRLPDNAGAMASKWGWHGTYDPGHAAALGPLSSTGQTFATHAPLWLPTLSGGWSSRCLPSSPVMARRTDARAEALSRWPGSPSKPAAQTDANLVWGGLSPGPSSSNSRGERRRGSI